MQSEEQEEDEKYGALERKIGLESDKL